MMRFFASLDIKLKILITFVIVILGVFAAQVLVGNKNASDIISEVTSGGNNINGFDLGETATTTIDLDKVVSGGPGRDGIPPIDNPKFKTVSESDDIPESTLGILVELNGETRYYPYNILTWHEIVNDQIGDDLVSVTFCPLCGSAAVYNRVVDGQTVRFGVSGLLYESNLLMYDDITESLWSQSLGKGVVGTQTDKELERLPTQLVSFKTVKSENPDAQVLSTDTGYSRDYSFSPYGDYESEDNEQLYFSVSNQDNRLPAKTIMFVMPVDNDSLAVEFNNLEKNKTYTEEFFGKQISVTKNDNDEIDLKVDGQEQFGYFEMWFSWATQNQENGEYWKIN